jgi:rfaE bifunctional protein kinase chain/domain
MNFQELFSNFSNIKVAIIGDVMLDTYMWGNVERISPEAPVPVVALKNKEYRIGGAGNVALNTVSLGATTTVLSVIGNDDDGKQLKKLFEQNNINCNYLIESSDRLTTNKIRIIARNQQMMRLDAEHTNAISDHLEQVLIEKVKLFFTENKPDVLILEDYNKGVLTEKTITTLIALCKEHGVITAVDPKRKNFFSYKGVDIFKPNLKEVKDGLNLLIDEINEASLQHIHTELKQLLQHEISLITLSEKGMFYHSPSQHRIIPTHVRSIADVSGAGDTVIAVASLVYVATKNIDLAAEMANIAGGIVCEEVGTVAINKIKLMNECKRLLQ